MLLLAVCVLVVLSPLVIGRWPAGLLLHQWKWPWLVWAALLLQIIIMQVPAFHGVAPAVHIATYVVAGTFLWMNRRMPGALIVGLGALSNGGTIVLNGGTLPATPEAVAAAGLDIDREFANSAVVQDPVLPWLGDVFAWPAPLPLANTFSVGDVLIVVGVVVAAWTATRRIGTAAPEPAEPADPAVHGDG